MLAVNCPTCHGTVPLGDAEDGDWLRCPLCESGVKARRPARVAAPTLVLRPPNPNREIRPVLAVFAGVAFACLLVCGGFSYAVYDTFTDPDFQTYSSDEGRFSIEYPGKPYRANPLTYNDDGLTSFPAIIYERSVPDDSYMVAWVDLPPERVEAGAEAILADACTGVTQHNPMVAGEVSRTAIVVNGHPGYDVITATRGSHGKGIVRAVLAKNRLYIAIVCGSFIQPDSTRALYFLKSFKVW